MRRIGYLYEKMCDIALIRYAIHKAAQGKTQKHFIKKVLDNIDEYALKIQDMLVNDKVELSPNRQIEIYDRSCSKTRLITVPKFYPDQILHWVVMLVLEPILSKGMYRYTCGSVPTRGGMEAKRFVERALKDTKVKYVAKLDISKFFNSVKPKYLLPMFERKIKDKKVIALIDKILTNGGDCLPIGYYTSQWFSNFFLEGFDHYVKEKLGIKYYVRYVDDIATLENQKLASDTERKTTLDQSLADLLTYYNSDMQGLKTDVGAITQKFFNQNKELQQGNYEDLASLISGDLKTEDLATFIQRIDSADIDDNQEALLKTLATNQVNNNITTRQNSTFENFKNVIANLTDTSIENAYAKIDALDITDNQKAQLKTLVDSQVANNQYTLREENKQQLLLDLETDYESASGADEWQNALNRLEQNKDLLDDTTYNYWKNRLQSKYDAVKKEEEETAQAELDERILTGKEYISYNGANYKITLQLNDSSNEIKRNNDFKGQLKDKFGTTNPYDSKIPNGTTFEIKCDNRGSNDFNFRDDIGAFLLSPLGHGAWDSWANWNTRYVTYYNGNWYLSEKK